MKRFVSVIAPALWLGGALLLAPIPIRAVDADDPGVLYLTQLDAAPVRLKILKDTPVNMTPASNTYLTTLRKGQSVELLAISERLLLVRGRMSTGSVQGWVRRDDVTTLPKEFVEELEKKDLERRKMDEAIRSKTVIFDMTEKQVIQVLGRPEEKTSIREEDESTTIWSYYSYRKVPVQETYGYGTNLFTRSFLQKVRTGSQKIHFKDGRVVRIEEKSEEAPPSGINVPPVYVP